MLTWVVNVAGILLIGFIVWWFWRARPRPAAVREAGPIRIVVESGVYTPSAIVVPAGRPVTLQFLRKDPSPCAEQVRFDDLGVAAELPIGSPRDVTLPPVPAGEHEFTCQMRMYRGRLVAT